MRTIFPYQNRDTSFQMTIVADSATGAFSFGLGCSGLSSDTIILSGESGFLKNVDGGVIGSYLAGEPFVVSGNFYDTNMSVFLNGTLVDNRSETPNQGVDFVFMEGGDMNYQIMGSFPSGGYRISYITSSEDDEADIINMISGMGIWGRIDVLEDQISGQLSEAQLVALNESDLVVVGFENDIDSFVSGDSWSGVVSPIVILEPEVASQGHMNIISGSPVCMNENIAYCTNVGHEDFDRTNFSGTGDRVDLFESWGEAEADIFFYELSSYPERQLLTGLYSKVFLSETPVGATNFSGATPQSGDRIIFTVAKTGDYGGVMNTLGDEWRKILLSTVRGIFA